MSTDSAATLTTTRSFRQTATPHLCATFRVLVLQNPAFQESWAQRMTPQAGRPGLGAVRSALHRKGFHAPRYRSRQGARLQGTRKRRFHVPSCCRCGTSRGQSSDPSRTTPPPARRSPDTRPKNHGAARPSRAAARTPSFHLSPRCVGTLPQQLALEARVEREG